MKPIKPFKPFKDAIDLCKDYGEQALVGVGLKNKEAARYDLRADGSVDHNIDLSDFSDEQRAMATDLIESTVKEIEELEHKLRQARRSGDDAEVARYERKVRVARAGLNDIKFELEHTDIDAYTVGAFAVGAFAGGMIVEVARREAKLFDRIEDAQESAQKYHLAEGRADGASTTGTTGASGDSTKTEADGWPEGLPQDQAELGRMFERDPQAFFEKLQGADSETRAAIIMMVQTELQKNNQLMSTLTNFLKAEHDTQKAVISNLRV